MYSSIRKFLAHLPLFIGIAVVFAVLAPTAAQAQDVIYVDADATAPGDGQSWGTAYADLQDALAAVTVNKDTWTTNDEIWIAEGTYTPTTGTNRDISFTVKSQQNGLEIYGGFDPGAGYDTFAERDWRTHRVVLSGDIDGDGTLSGNSYHVLYFDGGAWGFGIRPETVLDGVTVTGGNADGSPYPDGAGDGAGGGLYCASDYGYYKKCNPTLRNIIFSNNHATYFGGAIYNDGGAGGWASPRIINAVFAGNTAAKGAAIFNRCYGGGKSSPQITNAVFTGNAYEGIYGVIFNGGIAGEANLQLTNVTFARNAGGGFGPAIYIRGDGDRVELTNVILWGNGLGGGGGNDPTVVFHHVLTTEWGCPQGARCSDIITAAPRFVNADDPDGPDGLFGTEDDGLRLTDGSPALNAGTPDTSGLGLTPMDLAGNPRIFQNGDPALRVVDLGAYEFQGEPLNHIYVDVDATGANKGTSWTDAFTDLQKALAVARVGNVGEIWVAEGTYTPTDGTNRGVSFELTSRIALYGGFAGTETQRDERDWVDNPTILSGDLGNPADSTDNSYHILYAHNVDSTTVLDGFTVTGGHADGGGSDSDGGGLYCDGEDTNNFCNPTIRNVTFTGNSASGSGGAMYNDGSGGGTSNPMLMNVTLAGNSAGVRGGAMYNDGFDGGESSPTLTNVLFADNSASGSGGAMYNTAGFSGESSPTLVNGTFTGNSTNTRGGAMYNDGSSGGASAPQITNSIFFGNTAVGGGDEILNNGDGATPVLRYVLVEGGCADIAESGGSSTDCGDGSTILTGDPRFANPADPDGPDDTFGTEDDGLRLLDGSPALDAGTPDTTGLGLPLTDLTGGPRVEDNDADTSTPAVVDLGAYEAPADVALPVELASFDAVQKDGAVVLTWKTLSEHGSDRFDVQRAVSGDDGPRTADGSVGAQRAAPLQWHTVGSVSAAGTTTEAHSYTFTDADVPFTAGAVVYRLKQIDLDGTAMYVAEVEVAVGTPEAFALHGNFPNPFARSTTIRYALPEARHVRLAIYDVLGRRVAVLIDEEQEAGRKEVVFAPGASGLSSGVYFYRLKAGDYAETRRMVVVR